MPRFASFDGTRLHYDDTGGGGLPLLCLPGLTRNGRDFDYVAPHLADQRVIRLDARGRGLSDRADPATYTVETETRDVLALLDHLGLRRVAILGTSRGGLVAMVLAASAKDRLIGVCLNDIGPELDPRGLAAIRSYVGTDPGFPDLETAAKARAALFPEFTGVPDSRWRDEVRHNFVETPEGLHIAYDPALAATFNQADGAAPAPDLWPLFDALQGLPLALIRGARSSLLSAETAARMTARRPDMIVATVPGRGHVPFLDEPEALAALHAWIEALQ
ncbi:alpha/beta fold hydrolase [Palleronia sp. KMU-117]|uniref:alpha/beta fold hydrolase n=1 Tax=Palleronia sp. KMU-117 TaxID=3434108 RepID=UPI003D705120